MKERRRLHLLFAVTLDLKKGDEVVTNGGIIGKVSKVDEKEVLVEVKWPTMKCCLINLTFFVIVIFTKLLTKVL